MTWLLCLLGLHQWSAWRTRVLRQTRNLVLTTEVSHCARCGAERRREPEEDLFYEH